ncbi:MAG TPA: LCP family protein [Candidatus Acidoferrales bacterium]|nr:LCP family protein [Candidatus Acidoferrales bacterium]
MDNDYRPQTRRRRPARKRVFFALLVAFILIFGVLIWKSSTIIALLWNTGVSQVAHLAPHAPPQPINLLLLGVGGAKHDGPDLTDTIIFMHIDPVHKKVMLVSLPRDLWIPDLHAKVNAAYTFANEKSPGSGLLYTKTQIGNILGQHIDYAIKLDFGGFVKAVDIMGGLDIDVARTFDDYAYPITGNEDATCGLTEEQIASDSAAIASGSATELESFPCRYKHIHFDKGISHMDGETALEYVRSRHALGPEGSDFARSKRQEKVISAFKAKLFSLGTLSNPVKVIDLVNTLQGSFETDIPQSKYSDWITIAQDMKGAKISSAVIDTGDTENDQYGLLTNPPISDDYGGAWVLVPRAGPTDYSEIQQYVSCQVAGKNCIVGQYGIVTPTLAPKPTKAVTKQ